MAQPGPGMWNSRSISVTLAALSLFCLALGPLNALGQSGSFADDDSTAWSFGGHSKYQYIHTRIPGDSVLQDTSGDNLQDHNLEVRLRLS